MARGGLLVRLLALVALLAPRGGSAAEPSTGNGPPEGVAEVRIEPEREAPRAGEALEVFVVLLDPQGGPADAEVALYCDVGTLGAVARAEKGIYHASLTLPQVLPGSRSVLLVARAGVASAERSVPLAPGPAATIDLTDPGLLNAGRESVRLEVTLRDAFGNLASGAPRVRARLGSVGPARASGPGRWEFQYTVSPLADERRDVLTAEAGSLSATREVRLSGSGSWLSFSPWAGAVMAGEGETGLAAGAEAAWWWGARREELGLLLDAGWWRLERSAEVPLPEGAARLADERQYVPLTAALAWGHRLGGRAVGWLGLGGGAARVSTSQRLAGQPVIREAGWGPAAGARVGLGVRAWRGMPFLEVRGLWIGDPGLVTWTGSVEALLLIAGYRLDAR